MSTITPHMILVFVPISILTHFVFGVEPEMRKLTWTTLKYLINEGLHSIIKIKVERMSVKIKNEFSECGYTVRAIEYQPMMPIDCEQWDPTVLDWH